MSALAGSLFLASCGDVGQVTQPLEPAAANLAKGGNNGQLKLVDAFESSTRSSVSHYRIIDRDGGTVGDDAYNLDVPPSAVSQPTLFVIRAANGDLAGKMAIEATATSCPSGDAETCYAEVSGGTERTNDVGAAGFRVPVRISIGFNPGGGNKKWRGLKMVLIQPDGDLVPVPTNVFMAQKEVRGHADHFSLYGIAWP